MTPFSPPIAFLRRRPAQRKKISKAPTMAPAMRHPIATPAAAPVERTFDEPACPPDCAEAGVGVVLATVLDGAEVVSAPDTDGLVGLFVSELMAAAVEGVWRLAEE